MRSSYAVLVGMLLGSTAGAGRRPPMIEFSSNDHIPSSELRAALSPIDDPIGAYDQDALDRDLLLVSAYFWDRGYAKVKVGDAVYDPAHDVITIPIDEGPRFTVGAVTITGELLGKDDDNLAMVGVQTGDLFSRRQIAEGRETLTTYYEDKGYASVDVGLVSTEHLGGKTIDLTFQITRGKLAHFDQIKLFNHTRTADAVLQHQIAIVPHGLFNATAMETTRRKLRALGKFESVNVTTKHHTDDTLVDVNIEVE